MVEFSKPAQGLNLNQGARDQNATPKADNADQTRTGVSAPESASARPASVDSAQALGLGDKAPGEPLGESTASQGPPVRLNIEAMESTLAEGAALAAVDRAGIGGSEGAEDGETIYSSYPIPNFALGPFQFEQGVLRLKGDRLEQFEKLLNDDRLPASDRALIRKLDISRVDAIVEARRAVQGGFDSSVGRAALERLHQDMPTIGTQDISHAKRPQMDNNVPVMPQPAVDPEGETGLDQGPHTAPEAGADQQQVPGAQG